MHKEKLKYIFNKTRLSEFSNLSQQYFQVWRRGDQYFQFYSRLCLVHACFSFGSLSTSSKFFADTRHTLCTFEQEERDD